MSSIVRKFDDPKWDDLKWDDPKWNDQQVVPFLMYCAETLALLPFISSDEPLYLIYSINRVIQVRAGAVEANLKASLQKDVTHTSQENGRLYQEQAQPYPDHVPMMDLNAIIHEESSFPSSGYMTSFDLNGAVVQEPVSRYDSCHPSNGEAKIHTRSSDSREMSEVEIQKVKKDCLAATALQLLLKLKRHLKVVYSLDDGRCQAFAPNEPLKPGDVLSRQNIPFDIRKIRATLPSAYQDLVQRYQEFKNALREDTIDYSVYSANIKRKRPTPRKSSRSTRTMASYEEEDDEDDENYRAPSARRLSYSGRKSTRR